MSSKKGFTLIELLVVIAIIAILAAILFPVFAQAKEAAKKTQSLTNTKQTATSLILYAGDNDDNLPSAYSHINGTSMGLWVGYGGAYPAGWCNNGWYRDDEDNVHWANSTEPYRKNPQITEFAGVPDEQKYAQTTQRTGGPKPNRITLAFNGFLHLYSLTNIGAPSTVALLWPGHGMVKHAGVAYSTPYLACYDDTQPCRFNSNGSPNGGANSGNQGGAMWYTDDYAGPADFSYYVYAKGYPIVRADTSAKQIRVGSPSQSVANNNPFGDPFATYDAQGIEWSYYTCYAPGQSSGATYMCYFRPDRDQYGQ